jgi:hypothetical protein
VILASRCRSTVDQESFTEVSLRWTEGRMQAIPFFESWAEVNAKIVLSLTIKILTENDTCSTFLGRISYYYH